MAATIVLLTVFILLVFENIKLRRIYRHHIIVSNLAEVRRKLIMHVHNGEIKTDSSLFKIIYMCTEILIKIRYWNLVHLLPNTNEFFDIRKLEYQEHEMFATLEKEIIEISKGRNKKLNSFLGSFFAAVTNAFIKNKVWFVINLLGRVGFDRISKRIKDAVALEREVNKLFGLHQKQYCMA